MTILPTNWFQIVILIAAVTTFAPNHQRTKGRLWTAALGNVSPKEEPTEKALFGMGCFWGPQDAFYNLRGVVSATTGYASTSGNKDRPASYLSICAGDGRTEAVLIEYLPSVISYQELLTTFWLQHNAWERQKPQYQSAIWPLTAEQRKVAEQELAQVKLNNPQEPKTVIVAGTEFSVAESVHQNFWSKLRLKLACLAAGTLLGSTSLHLDGLYVTDATVKLVLLWVLWEGLELVLKGLGSLGCNLWKDKDRIKLS